MKMPHIIVLLIVALLIFALVSQGYGSTTCDKSESICTQKSPCALMIKNTDCATIGISTDEFLPDTISIEDLKKNPTVSIAPHQEASIAKSTWFSIYTRVAVTNDMFERHYTVVQRACKTVPQETAIAMNEIETNQLNPKRFIVIDHLMAQGAIAEQEFTLCPKGQKALLDTKEEQWLCKHLVDGKTDYVPVYSYIYQWLPEWIISQWYTKHPEYYNWYHSNPQFWQHLAHYKTPWQTTWYATWYKNASDEEKKYLHKPDTTPVYYERKPGKPFGLAEQKVILKKD